MKKIKRLLTSVAIAALAVCASTFQTKAEPAVAVSFQFFYDNLSPYGAWVSYPSYGYVWVPRVSAGFRPYFSSGNWVYTDLGWTWVSSYDWGWAPFHYGSWLDDPFYGWLWVPGYAWSPAWVTWGYYSDYYGWAPLAPGISFSVSYYPPIDYWVFVPPRYITVSGWNNTYYVANRNRIVFDNNTAVSSVKSIRVVDNTGTYNGQRFSAGPPRAEFERAANTKIAPVALRESNAPGKTQLSGNSVSIYRPKVDASDKSSAKPSKVTPLESMKRSGGGTNDAGKLKSREGNERTAPAPAVKEKAPANKTAPVQKEQPKMQERKQPAMEQKRNDNVQPRTKERQPEAKPKSNVESSPQMNERKNAAPNRERPEPSPQYRERSKQSPSGEKIQRSRQREPQPQVMPERKQQMDRQPPREPKEQRQPNQPQPQQREEHEPHIPK